LIYGYLIDDVDKRKGNLVKPPFLRHKATTERYTLSTHFSPVMVHRDSKPDAPKSGISWVENHRFMVSYTALSLEKSMNRLVL